MAQSDVEFQITCHQQQLFRLFTKESITKIKKKRKETNAKMNKNSPTNNTTTNLTFKQRLFKTFSDKLRSLTAKKQNQNDDRSKMKCKSSCGGSNNLTEAEPHPSLEAGKRLPSRMEPFPQRLYGKPVEDADEYYSDKMVSLQWFVGVFDLMLYEFIFVFL